MMNCIRGWCKAAFAGLGILFLCTLVTAAVMAQEGGHDEPGPGGPEMSESQATGGNNDALFYTIAITMGLSCASAGYAVGKVGASALGAASEKPELLGRALIFVGLAEGIAIYGLIISVMLIAQL